jgi:hypothetical protein
LEGCFLAGSLRWIQDWGSGRWLQVLILTLWAVQNSNIRKGGTNLFHKISEVVLVLSQVCINCLT